MIHFIKFRYKGEIKGLEELKKILPKKVGIFYIEYFEFFYEKIKEELKKEFEIYEGGLILGCNVENATKIKDIVDVFLLIGEGKFHALEIVRKTCKRVIIFNPIYGKYQIIDEKEFYNFWKKIEILREELKEAKKIGIIVSIKPGQYNLNRALELKEKFKDKEVYLFLADTIDFNELLNFDIDFWIFVGCPRLIDDILERKIKGLTDTYLNF